MGDWYSCWKPEREKVELEELSSGDEHGDASHPFNGCHSFEDMRKRLQDYEEEYPGYDLAFDYKEASFGQGAREMRWMLVGLRKP